MSDTGLKFSSRPVLMLAAGAVLGLVLVAADLFRVTDDPAEDVPEGVIATVNGVGILAAEYGAALDRYALSRGGSLDGSDSTLVLDSMIDEELLVQRARDLRIDRNDRLVRDLMAKTVVEVVAMEAESTDPTSEEIVAFYEKNGDLFARDPKVRVREIRIEVNQFRSANQAAETAAAATARLKSGDEFARVNREMGDRPEVPLPDRPLTEAELRQHLGAAAASRALEMEPGQISEPVRSGSGFHVLKMVSREAPMVPPLYQIEAQVKAEMRRLAHQGAIKDYVVELRSLADIQVSRP